MEVGRKSPSGGSKKKKQREKRCIEALSRRRNLLLIILESLLLGVLRRYDEHCDLLAVMGGRFVVDIIDGFTSANSVGDNTNNPNKAQKNADTTSKDESDSATFPPLQSHEGIQ